MALGDLFHERQAQAHTALALGMAGQAEKGFEDAFAQGLGHAGSAVTDAQFSARRDAACSFGSAFGPFGKQRDACTDVRGIARAIAACVLEQIAQGAAQQAFIAQHHQAGGSGLHLGAHPCRFFGGHGDQVDLSIRRRALLRGLRIEPAGQQYLFNQRIQIGDVDTDLGAQPLPRGASRRLFEQGHRHLHARQRRAQFMAGIGQQRLVRSHQGFDAPRSLVEAGSHGGDFVAARDIDALAQGAGTEALDTFFQGI